MRSMHPSPCEIDRSLHGFDKASARGRKGSWQKQHHGNWKKGDGSRRDSKSPQ